MKKTNTIIIGAGPAGLMCASQLILNNIPCIIIDQNSHVGKKLRLTGGGRCNITSTNEVEQHIIHNPKFMRSALSTFGPSKIVDFFHDQGVLTHTEKDGRVFPQSNNSETIINAFLNIINQAPNTLHLNECVNNISMSEQTVTTNKEHYSFENIVIACGGKSLPKTGSDGSIYPLILKSHHTLTNLKPAESAVITGDDFKPLQGLTLDHVAVITHEGKKKIINHGPLLFTHFGVTGPAVLRSSLHIYNQLQRESTYTFTVDLLPDVSEKELIDKIKVFRLKRANTNVHTFLTSFLPKRLSQFLTSQLSTFATFSKIDEQHLIQTIKSFPINAVGTKSFDFAFVTAGGVNVKEINPNSFESKLHKNLYFAGEIIDLHGHTGGYNLTIAFSSAYLAAQDIIKKYTVL